MTRKSFHSNSSIANETFPIIHVFFFLLLGSVLISFPSRSQETTSIVLENHISKICPIPKAEYENITSKQNPELAASTIDLLPNKDNFGFFLYDISAGRVLESHNADHLFIPASVTKIITAFYALDTLGAHHTFSTKLYVTNDYVEHPTDTKLYLIGEGDPTLDSYVLHIMAQSLKKKTGLRTVKKFYYGSSSRAWEQAVLNKKQPLSVPYNPSIGYLNLNFNRVLLQWRNRGNNTILNFYAHADHVSPKVNSLFHSTIIPNDLSKTGETLENHTYSDFEKWHFTQNLVKGQGSLWLPVRKPGYYAASVFRILAKGNHLSLPPPEEITSLPKNISSIVIHTSQPTYKIITNMLRYSTNLTAEILGLEASRIRQKKKIDTPIQGSQKQILDIEKHIHEMLNWLNEYTIFSSFQEKSRILNFSGLSTETRISPRQAVFLLLCMHAYPDYNFPSMLPKLDNNNTTHIKKTAGITVTGKTGTMYYSRAVTGYIQNDEIPSKTLGFVIFHTDFNNRNIIDKMPEKTRRTLSPKDTVWLNDARKIESDIIQQWIYAYLIPDT
jgi:D-alanyl-D-alanine carboxypeptidase/D-alanyl-D-alanine-endopeptidase (penicillin-binding protein 4)